MLGKPSRKFCRNPRSPRLGPDDRKPLHLCGVARLPTSRLGRCAAPRSDASRKHRRRTDAVIAWVKRKSPRSCAHWCDFRNCNIATGYRMGKGVRKTAVKAAKAANRPAAPRRVSAPGKAQDEMRERASRSERQLATAQQITHMGSWEWDCAKNQVSWSDELYRIYGLLPRSCEITFESFLSRVHPEDRERIRQSVYQAVESKGSFRYRERIVRPDGTTRLLDTAGEASFDERGRFAGLIGTCRDISEEFARA